MNDNNERKDVKESTEETLEDGQNAPSLGKTLRRFERLLMHYHAAGARRFGPQGNPNRGQGRVLALLKMQPDIAQRDLSYLLDMRQQSLSELLGKLEQKGYISREADEKDKRIVNIHLTEDGKKAAEEMNVRKEDKIFDCLNPEEQAQFTEYLGRINEALESRLEEMGVDANQRHGHGPYGGRPAHGYGHGPHHHGACEGGGHHGERGRHGCGARGGTEDAQHHECWDGSAILDQQARHAAAHRRGKWGPGGAEGARSYRSETAMLAVHPLLFINGFDDDGLMFFDL